MSAAFFVKLITSPRCCAGSAIFQKSCVTGVTPNGHIVPEVIHPVVDEQRAEEQAAGQEEDLGHVPVPESDLPSEETPDRWGKWREFHVCALGCQRPPHARPRSTTSWSREPPPDA